jgi:hypothetical protein
MGEATIKFNNQLDQIDTKRKKIDGSLNKIQDHLLEDIEIAENDETDIKKGLSGFKLFGTNNQIDSNSSKEDIKKVFNSGVGVKSNRVHDVNPPTGSAPPTTSSAVQKTEEINTEDPTNQQRLRLAGLTEKQMNQHNIFVDLGDNKIGFYSKGFGAGDERSGVITIDKNGKVEGAETLGGGWNPADSAQKDLMKQAFDKRDELIREKFGDYNKYKEFESIRAKVDDLLSHQDVSESNRQALETLKKSMESPDKTKISNILAEGKKIVEANSERLLEIHKNEASASEPTINDISNLDQSITDKTNEVNKLDPADKQDLNAEKTKFDNYMKALQKSSLPEAQKKSYESANKFINGKETPQDKSLLAELKWQNARFASIQDAKFKSALENQIKEQEQKQKANKQTPASAQESPVNNDVQKNSSTQETKSLDSSSQTEEKKKDSEIHTVEVDDIKVDFNKGLKIDQDSKKNDLSVPKIANKLYIKQGDYYSSIDPSDDKQYLRYNDHLFPVKARASISNMEIAKSDDGVVFEKDGDAFVPMQVVKDSPLKGAYVTQDHKLQVHNYIRDGKEVFNQAGFAGGYDNKVFSGSLDPALQKVKFGGNEYRLKTNYDNRVLKNQGILNLEAVIANNLADTEKIPKEIKDYQDAHKKMYDIYSKSKNDNLKKSFGDIISADGELDYQKLQVFSESLKSQ